ncbi:MAG TPA: hypothetical protein VJ499_04880 [Flavisolibacter sp.]|nr:hypothetical protein [Flavisolibacter sp.]
MKRLLLSSFFLFLIHSVFAQQQYFIYLESENAIPFYVRMGDKIYSSSSPGYLVFPNLADSSYTMFIGVPSLGGKEARFQFNVQGNDHGYTIQTGGNELALADIETLAIISPVHMPGTANVTYEPRKDAFSSMLSKASNDSSLLMVPVFSKSEPVAEVKKDVVKKKDKEAPKAEEKPVTEPVSVPPTEQSTVANISGSSTNTTIPSSDGTLIHSDTLAMASTSGKGTETSHASADNTIAAGKPEEKIETAVTPESPKQESGSSKDQGQSEEPFERSVIKKYSESSTSEGFGLVYFDKNGNQTDTIRMLIPNPKIIFSQPDTAKKSAVVFMDVKKEPEPVKESVKAEPSTKDPVTGGSKITSTDTLDNSVKQEQVSKEPVKEERAVGGIIPAKPKCRAQASESDFFKLRKNMASEESDEMMVEQAMKSFKSRCFTTEQVKYLSSLFLTSAGKYLFFDAAYMHVSDRENFPSLRSEIKDDYYSRRFKALIGE